MMASTPIREIWIEGLHGRINMAVDLSPKLNLLHGRNGTGKTTLLHLLANLIEADLERFFQLRFDVLSVTTYEDRTVMLRRVPHRKELRLEVLVDDETVAQCTSDNLPSEDVEGVIHEVFGGRPVYVPAFRPVLEAASGSNVRWRYGEDMRREPEFARIARREEHFESTQGSDDFGRHFRLRGMGESVAFKTLLCRDWFGRFVPVVRFPSLNEVGAELMNEWQEATFRVAQSDRESFQDAFVRVLRAVFTHEDQDSQEANVGELLERIRHKLGSLEEMQAGVHSVYEQIASVVGEAAPTEEETSASRILAIYDSALSTRLHSQASAYKQIEQFEKSVNRFLHGKRLSVALSMEDTTPRIRQRRLVQLEDGRRAGLNVLSSGERHVVTLLFSATHMSPADGVLLIDEPELSFHVDWQRMIVSELLAQAGDRQIIVCTHAPEIAANHREALRRLMPVLAGDEPDLFDDEAEGE